MINSYLNQDGTLTQRAGFDRYAKSGYASSPIPTKMRFQSYTKTIQDAKGISIGVDGIVYVKSDAVAFTQDEVRVAGGIYRIVKVEDKRELDGAILFKKLFVVQYPGIVP